MQSLDDASAQQLALRQQTFDLAKRATVACWMAALHGWWRGKELLHKHWVLARWRSGVMWRVVDREMSRQQKWWAEIHTEDESKMEEHHSV